MLGFKKRLNALDNPNFLNNIYTYCVNSIENHQGLLKILADKNMQFNKNGITLKSIAVLNSNFFVHEYIYMDLTQNLDFVQEYDNVLMCKKFCYKNTPLDDFILTLNVQGILIEFKIIYKDDKVYDVNENHNGLGKYTIYAQKSL